MTGRLEPRRDAEGRPVMANGEPNPTGTGRYCMPTGTCYCRTCPGWKPVPPPDYSRAIAELKEKGRRR